MSGTAWKGERAFTASNGGLARIRDFVKVAGGKVIDDEPGVFKAALGSRLRYRLLGVMAGSDALPLLLSAHEDGDSSKVTLTLESNQGFYLVTTSFAESAYAARMDSVEQELSH